MWGSEVWKGARMVSESRARKVVDFLVATGFATPMEVGVCALNDRDGVKAWRLLNDLRAEGYVVKTAYATYRGHHRFAAKQRELWS